MPGPEEIVESAAPAVPAQEGTAPPAPEVVELPEPTDPPAPKVFTQDEVDAIVGKRLAKEQRKWERAQPAAPIPEPVPQEIKLEDFATPETYAEALAEKKAFEILANRETQQQTVALAEAYEEREEKAIEKYDDFQQVAYNPRLTITEPMAQAIRASEVGPDILYQLGSDPKEAVRIAKLPVFLQIKEIGKLEGKFVTTPPTPKKTTAAPAPIRPINAAAARPAGGPSYDTTDPRSVAAMSTSEWIEAERQRQIRKLQGQRTH